MKLGILVTTYNRPEYLEKFFNSLKRADIPEGTPIMIVDDKSTDPKTMQLIKAVEFPTGSKWIYQNEKNSRIAYSLKFGCNQLFEKHGCDVVMNLDSDAIVRNDFVDVLMKLHERFNDQIITGFNCLTKNADGSERHKILSTGEGYNTKKSVGGINMVFNKTVYEKYILPALETNLSKGGNWDHMACINSEKDKKPIICSVPSVVQHIGVVSSMGHTSTELPDTADDFKSLHLPDVTLIGVDCINIDRLLLAADKCMQDIQFGDVKMLSSIYSRDSRVMKIAPIKSIQEYSKFIMKEIADHVKTKHMLVIQHDGYVMNAAAWSNEFLKYDYIGAPWWYKDEMNVGNGGFSLRSKRLMDVLKLDNHFIVFHPEDHHICRTYHKYLVKRYDIKFAPVSIADKFSVEGWNIKKPYAGQFGFHGSSVNLNNTKPVEHVTKPKQPYIISQFQGLGDILFAMPMINDWIKEGHKIIWPVVPEYVALNKHFPLVTFIDMNLMKIDHAIKHEYETGGFKVIPLRWADQIIKTPYRFVMKAKYEMYHKDYRRWRELSWIRDMDAENKLFKQLGLVEGEKYNLVNHNFRTDKTGSVKIEINNGHKTIQMKAIDGYTLLDWGKVLENATEIHTPGTSINYILEVLNIKAEMHLYVRRPEEKDFSLYDYLLTKRYHYHR